MTTREDIVQVARSLLETPFHHMGRLPGVGLDCAGIWVCVARQLGLVPPDFDVPAYVPQPDGHSMIEWCNMYMGSSVARADLLPGHGIVLITDKDPQHLGIVGDYGGGRLSIIHASNSFSTVPPRVIETRLMFSRNQRFVAAYRFPGVED